MMDCTKILIYSFVYFIAFALMTIYYLFIAYNGFIAKTQQFVKLDLYKIISITESFFSLCDLYHLIDLNSKQNVFRVGILNFGCKNGHWVIKSHYKPKSNSPSLLMLKCSSYARPSEPLSSQLIIQQLFSS